MTASAESAARVRLRKAIAELAAASQALTDLYSMAATDNNPMPVLHIVAERFGKPVNVLLGTRRAPEVAWTRHIAVAMAKKWTGMNNCELGRVFHRDHGTMKHSVSMVKWRCTTDAEFSKLVAEIDAEVGAKLKNGKCV